MKPNVNPCKFLPFAWPASFPKNEDFFICTVNDEKELHAAISKKFPNGFPSDRIYGTHSGVFHCDEVMASLVFKYAKVFTAPAIIVRTRSDELLKKLKVVYDVGGICNPKEFRFDHHMRDFKETFDSEHDTKLSSCGLAYKYFGKEAIKNILSEWKINDEKTLDYTYKKLYEEFFHSVDAWDNGVNQYPQDLKPKYHINTHLAARVGRFNPSWNDATSSVDDGFLSAMDICEEELLWQIYSQAKVIYPAYAIVEDAYKNRTKFHPSGQFVVMDRGCPWKEHLGTLEEENKGPNKKPILFILCKEKDKEDYRVQGIPDKPGSFGCRLFLYEKWRGLRDAELQKVSGIPGAKFVHSSGFLGVASSYEGAMKMAEISVANAPPVPAESEKKKEEKQQIVKKAEPTDRKEA